MLLHNAADPSLVSSSMLTTYSSLVKNQLQIPSNRIDELQRPNVALATVDLCLAGLCYSSILHHLTRSAISLLARIRYLNSCRRGYLRNLLAGHCLHWLAIYRALANVWSLRI